MLIRLYYVSEVSSQLTDVDVQVILGASQIKNRRLDTGTLVQTNGHFLQIIEGREEAVETTDGERCERPPPQRSAPRP